jgi:hypothetical protein
MTTEVSTRSFIRLVIAGLALLLGALMAPPTQADDTSAAFGYFETAAVRVPITDGYAFFAESVLGEEEVLLVAVSNAGFEQPVIDRYWDRRYQLERFFVDGETVIVWIEFEPGGRFRGLTYRFAADDGCRYCAGDVESTVARSGDRLIGTLRQTDAGDGRLFEITLDLPISSDEHGVARGEGGGEPGAAYLAYHRALVGDRRQRLREQLSAALRQTWAEAEAAGQEEQFLSFLRAEHPRRVRVTQAFVAAGRSLLLLASGDGDPEIRGEAQMVLEDGSWRFVEETIATPGD